MNQNETPFAQEDLDRIRALLAEAYPLSGASTELEDDISSLLRRLEGGYYDRPALPPSADDLKGKAFHITSVTRQDLIDAGFTEAQVLALDDMAMDELASNMQDDYCSQLFWNHLRILAEPIIAQAVEEGKDRTEEEDEVNEEERDANH
jgi:hypothetical protein